MCPFRQCSSWEAGDGEREILLFHPNVPGVAADGGAGSRGDEGALLGDPGKALPARCLCRSDTWAAPPNTSCRSQGGSSLLLLPNATGAQLDLPSLPQTHASSPSLSCFHSLAAPIHRWHSPILAHGTELSSCHRCCV